MELDKLIKMGGNRWQQHGYDRIYFNNLSKLLELKGTGRIQAALAEGKFWYDIKKGKFNTSLYCKGINLKQMVIDRINELLGSDNEFTEILSDLDDI